MFSAFSTCSLVRQVVTVRAGIFIGAPGMSISTVVCHLPALARLAAITGSASEQTSADRIRLRSFMRNPPLVDLTKEYTSQLPHSSAARSRLDAQRAGERGRFVAALHHHHDGAGRS